MIHQIDQVQENSTLTRRDCVRRDEYKNTYRIFDSSNYLLFIIITQNVSSI